MINSMDSNQLSTTRKAFFKRTRNGSVIRIVREHMIRDDVGFGFLSLATSSYDENINNQPAIADISSAIDMGDDISPGMKSDMNSSHDNQINMSISKKSLLSSSQRSNNPLSLEQLCMLVSQSPHNQLLIIDTNIALHQIDLLEHQCPGTALILVTQTVLQELQHLNIAVYRRMNALLCDEKRSYIFYPNEISSDTIVNRLQDETINDKNDRAVRKTAEFFHQSLSDHGSAVLITNDDGNLQLAIQAGIPSYTIQQYVKKYLSSYPELFDLLSYHHQDDDDDGHKRGALYMPYLTMKDMMTGIRAKKYMKGCLRVKRDRWYEGYVVIHMDASSSSSSSSSGRKSVTIIGKKNINRAIDGDVVVIEFISKADAMMILDRDNDDSKHHHDSNDDKLVIAKDVAEASYEDIEGLQPTTTTSSSSSSTSSYDGEELYGRVIGIMKRNWRQYAGSIDPNSHMPSSIISDDPTSSTIDSFLFYPVDHKLPPIRISTRRIVDILYHRLLVTIDDWSISSSYPDGHYVKIIGKDGEKQTETDVLLHEYGVPSNTFSPEVMACLPSADWKIPYDDIIPSSSTSNSAAMTSSISSQNRVDLRHIPIVSIDPPGCKDIDDALHCIILPNGNYQVGVHIADVTYFVKPDSALDREAAHRSTSTYLVERRLDMLPGYLTTQLCSLRSGEDHLAFSIVWEMTPDGQIIDVSFYKSVIHSVASLTYDQAQTMLDMPDHMISSSSSSYDAAVIMSVKRLNILAKIFRAHRIMQGALTLASPEVRFKLDDETSNPSDVTAYALKESNALVEEFMLLANITVSKKILRHYPTLAILRRHQPPSREQFAPLVYAAHNAAKVHIDISSSKALADSLDDAVRDDDVYFNKLLRILSTRCMMPAQYFCSGEVMKDHWHHYGLAAPVYTHFTSPIRRYADILVHRLLAAAIGVCPLPAGNTDRAKQQELCTHMNRRHRAAQHAQRASVNLYTLLYFKNHPTIETAYVLSVSEQKVTLLVPKFGIESSIDVTSILPDDVDHDHMIKYDESSCRISIMDKKYDMMILSLQVFQRVQVSIRVEEKRVGTRVLVMNLIHTSSSSSAAASSSIVEVRDDDNVDDGMMIVADTSAAIDDKDDIEVEDEDDTMKQQQIMKKKKRKVVSTSSSSKQPAESSSKKSSKRFKLRQY